MPDSSSAHTNDIAELRSIIEAQANELESKQKLIAAHETAIRRLAEQNELLKFQLFGRRSEKRDPEEIRQGLLFNEAETYGAGQDVGKSEVKKHSRRKKKGGRKALPASLPRVEIEHDLSPEEVEGRKHIGADIHEELVHIPEKIYVERHIYHKYALPEGVEGEPAIKTAPRVKRMIERSIASASLLASTLTAKFCDHLPFYRQEKIFARWNVELKRATMCNWTNHVARRSERLMELFYEHLKSGHVINTDETTVQVMKEEGRKDTQKSYMWLLRGGPPDVPVVIFEYRKTREASFLNERLEGFRGVLLTDGYPAYDEVAKLLKLVHAGCWDHARRKFVELQKTIPESRAARSALKLIGGLYAVEKKARKKKLSDEALLELRRKYSARRLRYFKRWLDRTSLQTPEKEKLGQAIRYVLGEWGKLTAFLEDVRIPISNILAENSIRPFVIGRKNWMFSGSPRGAAASATIYSIIETAKANDLEPYWYLRYLFELLPAAETDDDIRMLLPFHLSMETIRKAFPDAPG